MERGRPKAIIKRDVRLNLKLTKFESEKIEKISKKLNITKTEAILRGIDLLIQNKPKIYKNLKKKHNPIGNLDNDDDD